MEPAAFDLTTFSSEEDIESCGSSRRGRSRHVPHKELPAEVVDRRNERERRRVTAVNAEFRTLQKLLPTLKARTRRVSKEKILICALDYIKGLQRMIKEHSNVMDNMGVEVSQEPNMTCSDPWGGEQRWLQNAQRPFHYTHPGTEVMPDEPSPQPECCVPPGHCSHQRRVVGGLHMPALQDALGRQELSVPQDGGRQCQADSAVFSKYTPNYHRPCMRDITHSLNNAYNIQVRNHNTFQMIMTSYIMVLYKLLRGHFQTYTCRNKAYVYPSYPL